MTQYLVGTVLEHATFYLANSLVSAVAIKALAQYNHALIKDIHPHSLKIVDSFGIPEHLMTAPAANDIVTYNDGYFRLFIYF